MTESVTHPILRRALVLDAAASAAMALALVLGASFLSAPLGLPTGLLRGTGFLLVPWVVLLTWTTTRPTLAGGLVAGIVAANLAWVGASAWLLAGGPASPTALGTAVIVAQAAAVAVLADLQWAGLRRARPAAA